MSVRLVADTLAFGYGRRVVGRDVSMSLASGEIVALLGPNGAGKTTLFRTLLGLLRPLGGKVSLDGEDIVHMPRAAVARRIAYVPQAHTGYFPFTALDVVTMARTAHLPPFQVPSREDRAIALDALARVGVDALAAQVYTRISGGERQLVLIARALAQQASLIVMDEPTASLDFGNQVRIVDEIRRLQRGGLGILLSTHDPDQALDLADRVALLHDGRLITDAPPAEAVTPTTLERVYGVKVAIGTVVGADGRARAVCVPARR